MISEEQIGFTVDFYLWWQDQRKYNKEVYYMYDALNDDGDALNLIGYFGA